MLVKLLSFSRQGIEHQEVTTSVFGGPFSILTLKLSVEESKVKLPHYALHVRLSSGSVPTLRNTGPKWPSIPPSLRPHTRLDLEARIPVPLKHSSTVMSRHTVSCNAHKKPVFRTYFSHKNKAPE